MRFLVREVNVIGLIVACGGIGAFLDFLLGRAGQKKVRNVLERWWIQLAYIEARTFASAEASAAATILQRLFGKFFSKQRVHSIAFISTAIVLYWLAWRLVHYGNDSELHISFHWNSLVTLAVAILFFSVSISLNIWLANKLAKLIPAPTLGRIVLYIALLTLQITLFCFSYELQMAVVWTYIFPIKLAGPFSFSFWPPISDLVNTFLNLVNWIWPTALSTSLTAEIAGWGGLIANAITKFFHLSGVVRLLVLFIFVVSVLFRPFKQGVNLLIQRIVESEKPVLTMVFSGVAALASGIQALVREAMKLPVFS